MKGSPSPRCHEEGGKPNLLEERPKISVTERTSSLKKGTSLVCEMAKMH